MQLVRGGCFASVRQSFARDESAAQLRPHLGTHGQSQTRARDTYSEAVASAKQPVELFLAGTAAAAALRRRGMMHRELGQLPESLADFTALIDAAQAPAGVGGRLLFIEHERSAETVA
jgi:hypothetical protein